MCGREVTEADIMIAKIEREREREREREKADYVGM